MEWITENRNPIRRIQTAEIMLSEKEISDTIERAIQQAYTQENPCITSIRLSINRAIKEAFSKPKIS